MCSFQEKMTFLLCPYEKNVSRFKLRTETSHSMSNELTSSDVSRVIFIPVYQHEHPNPGAQKMKYTLYYKKNNQKRNHC